MAAVWRWHPALRRSAVRAVRDEDRAGHVARTLRVRADTSFAGACGAACRHSVSRARHAREDQTLRRLRLPSTQLRLRSASWLSAASARPAQSNSSANNIKLLRIKSKPGPGSTSMATPTGNKNKPAVTRATRLALLL